MTRPPSPSRVLSLALSVAMVIAVPAAHADPAGPAPGASAPSAATSSVVADPSTVAGPDSWQGPAPDPDQVPEAWTRATPAEQDRTPEPSVQGPAADSGRPGGGSTDATVAGVPAPPSKVLPAVLDAAPGFQFAYSCDPNDKPGMLAFAELVSSHYDRPRYTTSRRCVLGSTSKHHDGRAMDWPMNAYNTADKAIGDAVAGWLTANNGAIARRFGLMSVIWNRRVWYIWDPGNWRDYTGPSPHTDHLHFSFTWDGAMGRTSWWTGVPVTEVDQGTCRIYSGQHAPRYSGPTYTPCPGNLPDPPRSRYPVTLPGTKNDDVTVAQQHLGLTGPDVDGSFGPRTLEALLTYQQTHRLPRTGVLDNTTWAAMMDLGVPSPAEDRVTRVAGADRYETAALLARSFPEGRAAYVALGTDFPDALAVAALAGRRDAPVLLTRADTIPAATRESLERLRPSRITVLGGVSAVSDTVLDGLEALTTGPVERVGGQDRFDTAAMIARQFGDASPVVYVASGGDYPDALAGAARAATDGGPVLLTRFDRLPGSVVTALEALRPERIVVLGGETAVSPAVVDQLRQHAASGVVERVAGPDRYATAGQLATRYPAAVRDTMVATGLDYPDALAGSAVAGARGAPLLLVRDSSVPSTIQGALDHLEPWEITVLGGQASIGDEVVNELVGHVR